MVSERMKGLGTARSVIRELFEYGNIRAAEVGRENVFDFSIGNPSVPSPAAVNETAIRLLTEQPDLIHAYTSAQGAADARQRFASSLNRRFGANYAASRLYLTVGAAASLCCVLNGLTCPGDEFIVFAPYFPEYKVFIEGAGAKMVLIPAEIEAFQIDFDAFERALSPNTKGVLVNSPNNPSGIVYSKATLEQLAAILTRKSKEYGHPIYLISDEPYREIVYGDVEVPWVPDFYQNTLVCYSYSKSLSLPGQRIGWALIPDEIADRARFYGAFLGAARACGQVCAPALYQKVIARCGHLTADMTVYQQNRDLLYNGLTAAGYDCVKPQGAFYLFMAAPNGNAEAFSDIAKESGILIPAGTAYGCPGYLRISYCVPTERVERALPIFEKLIKTL